MGKTTACRLRASTYLNWDNADDRRVILRGVMSADFVRADCFARARGPLAVPAQTFLSQLL